jgi:DNA-binding LytR/AlgR family response regulator
MKILIIEDDVMIADTIELLLRQNGHETKKAKNNQEALFVSENFWPQLAIVDIHLRHSSANGIEIAYTLKQNFELQVIFLTGKTDSATFDLAKKIQPIAYLLKPFNHKELVFQVEIAFEHYMLNKSPDSISDNNSLFFPDKNGHRKINKRDVCYLKASGNFTFIYICDGTNIMLTGNLGYYTQFFTGSAFFQTHRSYLVNLDQIEQLSEDSIYFKGTKEPASIATSRRADFLKRITVVRTP